MKKENCKMSFYASIYSSWIGVAKANGYALSIYGNFENNLTLIAVPWYNDAIPYKCLLEKLCNNLDTTIWKKQYSFRTEIKAHNRLLIVIRIMKDWYINLNVIKPTSNILSDLIKSKTLYIRYNEELLLVNKWEGVKLECTRLVDDKLEKRSLISTECNLSMLFYYENRCIEHPNNEILYNMINSMLNKVELCLFINVNNFTSTHKIKKATLITYSLTDSSSIQLEIGPSINRTGTNSVMLNRESMKIMEKIEVFPFK